MNDCDVATLRVLFVDDELSLLAGISRNLVRLQPQWKPYFSNSPEDAMDVIDRCSKLLDVVVVDIDMPEIDGLTILQMLAVRHPHIVRITLSGLLDPMTLLGSDRLSNEHICKPVDVGRLCELIKATCRRVWDGRGDHGVRMP